VSSDQSKESFLVGYHHGQGNGSKKEKTKKSSAKLHIDLHTLHYNIHALHLRLCNNETKHQSKIWQQ